MSSFLSIEQTVGNSFTCLERNERTRVSSVNIALIRLIALENMAHYTLSLCIGEEFALIAEKTPCRNEKFYTHTASLRMHLNELALTRSHFFHYRAYAFLGNVYHKSLHRFEFSSVLARLIENSGSRNGKLIALAAHILDKDRQVHFASACNAERVGGIGL